MPNERDKNSEKDETVELREVRPGVYEPASQTCDATSPPPSRPRRITRRPSPDVLDHVESQFVTGFRMGIAIVRRVGKALNVKT